MASLAGLRLNRDDIGYDLTDRYANVRYDIPACSPVTPGGLAIATCDTLDSVSGRGALKVRPATGIMGFGQLRSRVQGRSL